MAQKYMIYTIHHKNEDWPAYKNQVVSPILAGPRPDKPRTDISLFDDIGRNIAHLHKTFSEFTATYWVWKNSKADCIGIMHYRRALNFSYESMPLDIGFCQDHGLTRSRLDEVFQNTDIAVGEPMFFGTSIFQQYKSSHPLYADEVFGDIRVYLEKNFGAEMKAAFETHFYKKGQSAYFKCQIMAKRSAFHDYAEFVFGILFHLNSIYRDKIQGQPGEDRFFAFIGERLMSFYVFYMMEQEKKGIGYKVTCYPISFYDSRAKFDRYAQILLSDYQKCARGSEPDGYMRHLFYHQKERDKKDCRVSLNINYRQPDSKEYSGVIVRQQFGIYPLNSGEKLESKPHLEILDQAGSKRRVILSNRQLAIEGGQSHGPVIYQTSGSRDLYKVYMIRWNEAGFCYHPEDKSLTQKQIFVFRRSGTDLYTASTRLYSYRKEGGSSKRNIYYYAECKKPVGTIANLQVTVSSERIDDEFIKKNADSITYMDPDGKEKILSVCKNGFQINGGAVQDTVTLLDWNNDCYEVCLATWFYFPYPMKL